MSRKNKGCMSSCSRARAQSRCVEVGIIAAKRRVFFFFKQKTAYEIDMRLEFRRVLFRSRLAGEPPDVLLMPRLGHLGLLDYHRAEIAIAEGRDEVTRMLPAIRNGIPA